MKLINFVKLNMIGFVVNLIEMVFLLALWIMIELDSLPADLDEVQRKIMQLEIEEAALKKIASRLHMNVRLTTYTARHTWATLARESGAPISIISAGLGHTSEEMTRVYLKDFDQETLAKVNRIVTNLL